MQFTACYTKLEHGYMGQLLEWPGVITEGNDLEDCEEMLKDAAHEMFLVYKDENMNIPHRTLTVKPISILLDDASSNYCGHHDVLTNGKGKCVTIKKAEMFDEYTVNALCKEAGIPDIFQTLSKEDK